MQKIVLFILIFQTRFAFAQSTPFLTPSHKPLLGDIHFGNRVGGEIAQEGQTQKLICLENGARLQSIQVNLTTAKNVVKGIKMTVLEGNQKLKTYAFGDTNGVWMPKVMLKKNQNLVGISGSMGWFIDAIRFHFSDGSQTQLFGGGGGDIAFRQVFNKNKKQEYKGRWIGFWGSATDQLETIGLVFMAVE